MGRRLLLRIRLLLLLLRVRLLLLGSKRPKALVCLLEVAIWHLGLDVGNRIGGWHAGGVESVRGFRWGGRRHDGLLHALYGSCTIDVSAFPKAQQLVQK